MKPFKINRASWHYKLNTKFMPTGTTQSWEFRHSNFCTYWRSTVLRIIIASFFIFVVGLVLLTLGSLIYVFPLESLKFFACVIGAVAAVVLIIALKIILKERKNIEKPESLFLQKYRAHKQKICPIVAFEG